MKPIIYIAGPYRGSNPWVVENNIRHAERAAFEVCKMGGVALCPHTMFRYFNGTLTDEFWIDATKQLLLVSQAALMCDGWKFSEGSRGELALAQTAGMPVLYESDWHAVAEFIEAWGRDVVA